MNLTTMMRERIMIALSHKDVGYIVATHELHFQCRATEPHQRSAVSRAIRQLIAYKVLKAEGGRRSQRYRILTVVRGPANVVHQTVEVDIHAIEERAVAQYITKGAVSVEEVLAAETLTKGAVSVEEVLAAETRTVEQRQADGIIAAQRAFIATLPTVREIFAEFLLALGSLTYEHLQQEHDRHSMITDTIQTTPISAVWAQVFAWLSIPSEYQETMRDYYKPAYYNLLAMVARGLVTQQTTTIDHQGPGVMLTPLGRAWVLHLVIRGVGSDLDFSPDGIEQILENPSLWFEDERVFELARQEGKVLRRKYDRDDTARNRHGAT